MPTVLLRALSVLLVLVGALACGPDRAPSADDSEAIEETVAGGCLARLEPTKHPILSYPEVRSCLREVPKALWLPLLERGFQVATSALERARMEHDAAQFADRQGNYREAIRLAQRASATFEAEGDLIWYAASIYNQGTYFSALGRGREALGRFEEASRIYRQRGDGNGEARVLTQTGWVFFLLGDSEKAVSELEQALEKRTDPEGRAATLDRLGSVYRDLGRYDEAEVCYREAAEIYEQNELRGHVIANQAWLALDQEHPADAEELLERALPILRRLGDRDAETHTLVGLALAARHQGRLHDALRLLGQALELVEGLRGTAGSHTSRSTFIDLRHDYYLEQVDLLVDLHHLEPAVGWDRRALEADEERRARALLDRMLGMPRERPYDELEPPTGQWIEDLSQEIERLEERLHFGDVEEKRAVRAELTRAISEYGMARASLFSPTPVPPSAFLTSLGELRSVIDDQTSVLSYTLGKDRSLLFYLDSDTFEIFELPARSEIESLARTFHRVVKASRSPLDAPMLGPVGSRLADLLLAPVADRLRPRVRLVRDGVLHLVPFAALPLPGDEKVLLIERHTPTSLPSLSVMALLERQPRVDRLRAAAVVAPDMPASRLARNPRFPLLTNVPVEVDAITSRIPAGQVRVLFGRHATPGAVASLPFEAIDLLHIAAHGLVYGDLPEISKLVLSDAEGEDDFLRLIDIFNLSIPVELVVLSACETGIGEILRGEGMVGMSYAFLSAGASGVIASLWAVEDRSTARFMEIFYSRLLDGSVSAEEAVRQAQLDLLADLEGDYRAPFHWAAFELHGR